MSKKKFNVVNITKLYGLNEQFLNKLLLKYESKQINDFFVYFDDNWCAALYHDRFEELCKEIRDISIDSVISINPYLSFFEINLFNYLIILKNNGIKSVHELLKDLIDKDLIVNILFTFKLNSNSIKQHLLKNNR